MSVHTVTLVLTIWTAQRTMSSPYSLKWFSLCPSPTVPNLLPNVDECKKFEICTVSSLSKGQMHKIINTPGVRQRRINSNMNTNIYFAAVSGTFHLHSHCLLVNSHDAPVSPTCTNDIVYSKNNQNTVRI